MNTSIESRLGAYLVPIINQDYDAMRYTHNPGTGFIGNLLGKNFGGLQIMGATQDRHKLVNELFEVKLPEASKAIDIDNLTEGSAFFMRNLAVAIGLAFKQSNDNAAYPNKDPKYTHQDFIDDMKRGMQAQLHAVM